jgi:hypothetical protein
VVLGPWQTDSPHIELGIGLGFLVTAFLLGPNFDLYKGFFIELKKRPKFPKFWPIQRICHRRKKWPKLARFLRKNWNFSQIWLKSSYARSSHFNYITKLKKTNPASSITWYVVQYLHTHKDTHTHTHTKFQFPTQQPSLFIVTHSAYCIPPPSPPSTTQLLLAHSSWPLTGILLPQLLNSTSPCTGSAVFIA